MSLLSPDELESQPYSCGDTGVKLKGRQPALSLAAVALAMSGFSISCPAVDLWLQPQVRILSRATDNVRWASENQEAALGFDTGGGAVLRAATQDWHSQINPSFNIRRFIIGEQLDADEFGVLSDHEWQPFQRLILGSKADFVRNSTLTTETTDAGRINDVADRDTITLQPRVSWIVDDLSYVTGSYLYSDVSFSSDADGRLVDYNFQQINLGYNRAWTDRIQLSANGFVSRFSVQSQNSETMTYGAQIGGSYQYSDDLGVDGSIGYIKSDIDFQETALALVFDPFPRITQVFNDASTSTSGPIASASIRKEFEDTKSRLDFSRRVSPTIRGSQSLEDDILLSIEHRISSYWMAGFRGGYNMRTSEVEDLSGSVADLNRDQVLLSASMTYRWTEQLSVRSEYRFTHSKISTTGITVDTNALFVTLAYNGEQYFLGNH